MFWCLKYILHQPELLVHTNTLHERFPIATSTCVAIAAHYAIPVEMLISVQCDHDTYNSSTCAIPSESALDPTSGPSPFESNPFRSLSVVMTVVYKLLFFISGVVTTALGTGTGTVLSPIFFWLKLHPKVRLHCVCPPSPVFQANWNNNTALGLWWKFLDAGLHDLDDCSTSRNGCIASSTMFNSICSHTCIICHFLSIFLRQKFAWLSKRKFNTGDFTD